MLESKDPVDVLELEEIYKKQNVNLAIPIEFEEEIKKIHKKNIKEITHTYISPSLTYFKESREIVTPKETEDDLFKNLIGNNLLDIGKHHKRIKI